MSTEQADCRGGTPFYAKSAAYTGTGPHRVLGFNLGSDPFILPTPGIVPPDDPTLLPASWAAGNQDVFADDPQPIDYQHAQLALCMSLPTVTSQVVGSCSYTMEDLGGGSGTPVKVVSASYEFKLFEARTGRLVTSFRLSSSDPAYCPIGLSSGELNDKIAAAPDDNTIAARIRPFVEGRAR
jgi:hypothetical protein